MLIIKPAAGIAPDLRCQSLQLNQFDLANEAASVVGKERSHDIEHGVTEAADVQNVVALRRLHGLVGLQVDANQLRRDSLATGELSLILNELGPLRHYAGGTTSTCSPRLTAVDPAFHVADQHDARKLALAVTRVGFAKWK